MALWHTVRLVQIHKWCKININSGWSIQKFYVLFENRWGWQYLKIIYIHIINYYSSSRTRRWERRSFYEIRMSKHWLKRKQIGLNSKWRTIFLSFHSTTSFYNRKIIGYNLSKKEIKLVTFMELSDLQM